MNFKFLNRLISFIAVLFITGTVEAISEKPLVVLITSYNNHKWVVKNLNSVINQVYSNYRIIYIDDCSVDDTAKQVAFWKEKSQLKERFTFIRNPQRVGALENIYHAVHGCRDEEVIVSLDGDDWFSDLYALKRVNEAYASPDVWLTHGSFLEYPTKNHFWSIPIPEEIIDSAQFRTYRCPSHLRTFYAWLFKQIRLEDLIYEGEFFPMTWDQAIMFPMVEMAAERHQFIPEFLYVYNMANVINDGKVNGQLQGALEVYIRAMPPYKRLDRSPIE